MRHLNGTCNFFSYIIQLVCNKEYDILLYIYFYFDKKILCIPYYTKNYFNLFVNFIHNIVDIN